MQTRSFTVSERCRRAALVLALALIPCGTSGAQKLTTVSPEAVGMSSARLARLDETIRQFVDAGRVPGVVTLLARDGKVFHYSSYGKRDLESGDPLGRDAIFRIASQSKAVTSVAIMMLVEEGKIVLGDPVSKFIPAFRHTTVMKPRAAGVPADAPLDTVSAKRQITIRDLLTHTAGISYGYGPLQSRYGAAQLVGYYCADKDETIGAMIDRMATLPFAAQPGEEWVYGFNTDVLGYVVEKASGMSLDEFFRTRIFAPLRMSDTHFFLPREKASRLATLYQEADSGRIRRAPDHMPGVGGQGDYVDGPRKCFSGGAGLLSTARDYGRFLQMLLNGGELDGTRLLGPKTVDLMTVNHVGTLYNNGSLGFGLGFEIVLDVGRSGRPGSVGEFSWGGAYYTTYWVDPKEKIVAVFLTQLMGGPTIDLQSRWRPLVYQALIDRR